MNSNNLPAKSGNTFELTGTQYAQWKKYWQGGSCGQSITFLVMLPIFLFVGNYTMLTSGVADRVIMAMTTCALVAALGVAGCLRLAIRENLQRAKRIEVTNTGVTFKSLGYENAVNWYEITDVARTVGNEYMIRTKRGDFFIPADASWTEELVETIRRNAPALDPPAQLCLTMIAGYPSAFYSVIVALAVAFMFGPLRNVLTGIPLDIAWSAFLLIGVVGSIGGLKLIRCLPRLVRIGKDNLLIVNGEGERRFSWTQVKSVSSGWPTRLQTTDGTYIILWHTCVQPIKGATAEKEKLELAKAIETNCGRYLK